MPVGLVTKAAVPGAGPWKEKTKKYVGDAASLVALAKGYLVHETDVTTPASDIVEADYDSCYPEVELVVDYCSCDMMDIDLTFSIKKRKSKKKSGSLYLNSICYILIGMNRSKKHKFTKYEN